MSSLASYIAGGLALVLTLDFAAPSIATGLTRALQEPQESFAARFSPANSERIGVSQEVDRSRKASRLVVDENVSTVEKTAHNPEARQPVQVIAPVREVEHDNASETKPAKAPVGCDPAFSPLSRAAPTRFIGRCVV